MYKLVKEYLLDFEGTYLVGEYDMEYLLEEELEFLIFDRAYYKDYSDHITRERVKRPKRMVLLALEEERKAKLIADIIFINGKTSTEELAEIFDIEIEKKDLEISDRDKSILYLLSQGYSNKDIGMKLFLSEKTIKNNLTRIYSYLGVENKYQAMNLVRDLFKED